MDMPSSTYSASKEFEGSYVRPKAGRTLIVGSYVTPGKEDRRALYPDVLGVDMRAGPGVDRVVNLEHSLIYENQTDRFDHVECISVLEHSERPWLLAANIERLMNPGSTFYLSVPFVWRPHNYPGDYFRFTADGVRLLFPGIKWTDLLYADTSLHLKAKIPAINSGSYPYMARCEVLGFGVRI